MTTTLLSEPVLTMTMKCSVVPDSQLTITHLDHGTEWYFRMAYGDSISELRAVLPAPNLTALVEYIQDEMRHHRALCSDFEGSYRLSCNFNDSEYDGILYDQFKFNAWDNENASARAPFFLLTRNSMKRLIRFFEKKELAITSDLETPSFGLGQ